MIKKFSTPIFLVLILALNVLTYHIWFFGNHILTSGDWRFAFPESTQDVYTIPQIWVSDTNLGSINLGLTFAPKFILNGLLAELKVSNQLNSQLTYLWPIVLLSAIGYFYLGKRVLNSNIAGFFSSITYCFNVVTIAIRSGHMTLASAQAFSPFVFIWLIKTFQTKKYSHALITGILAYIVSFNEVRVFYILAIAMGIYYLYQTFVVEKFDRSLFIKNTLLMAIIFLLTLLLNSYWLIGFSSTTSEPQSGFDFLSRQLFGGTNYNIMNSFTAWNIWWTGRSQASTVQPIWPYFWLIPFMAIFGLILQRRNKLLIYFGIISLVGIFLGKQSGFPFTHVYEWLYHHVPGFNAYREASKFYLLILTGYSVLIGAFMDWLWKLKISQGYSKFLRFFAIVTIAGIFLYNGKPLITGEIGSIFVPRSIPPGYLSLRTDLLSETDYFKTMWIPTTSTWGLFSNTHPTLNFIELLNNDWNYLANDYIHSHTRSSEQDMMLNIMEKPGFSNLLNLTSVKYIIVPFADKGSAETIFATYGQREKYLLVLDRLLYLKQVDLRTPGINVYRNLSYRPHFYLTAAVETLSQSLPYKTASYRRINTTEYQISLNNINNDVTFLNFSERFHPDWKIRAGKFSWWKSLLNKQYFLSEKYHFSNEARMNSFAIDTRYLQQNYPQSLVRNPDGTYNISLTLYFRSQAELNLGLILASLTLLASLTYIIASLKADRKHKRG